MDRGNQAKTRSQELLPSLPHGWWEPSPAAFFQVHYQGAGSEVNQFPYGMLMSHVAVELTVPQHLPQEIFLKSGINVDWVVL